MLLSVDIDSQVITSQPLVSAAAELTIPRAADVPIQVQFYQNGVVVDPEANTAQITTSTVSATPTFTSPGHGFIVGQDVIIANHGGLPIPIQSVGISATAPVVTAPAHGLTTGDYGLAADGSNLAAGYYRVVIEGVSTADAVSGTITGSTVGPPCVITTLASHGLSSGELVTITGHPVTAVNATHIITVLTATTFSVPVTGGTSPSGTFIRAACDVNGTYIANYTGASTFTIPFKNSTTLYGGTMTCTTTTPTANGSRTIGSVTPDTFTTTGPTITAAGTGGTATKLTDLLLRWTVKNAGEYDGPSVATIDPGSFLKSGSGETTIFKGSCNYITTELNSLLGIDATATNTFTVSGATFTAAAAHGLVVGDSITFTAATTMPAGLNTGQTYYILTVPTTATFTVSATLGGTVITTTSGGTGTLTYIGYPTVDDVAEASLMAELSWTGAHASKTNWVVHNLRNDIYKGGETAPVTVNGADGKTALGSGIDFKAVAFATTLSSANWHFLGVPMITNTTDASPLGLWVVGLTARSASGFTVYFSGATDSANYALEWCVRPD